MAIDDDGRLLADLKALLASASFSRPFAETQLPLILPIFGSAYALDSSGHVIGIKISRPPQPQRLLEMLLRFTHLRRLVLFADDADVVIPASIVNLKQLEFLWLGGTVKRLPPEILDLNLRVQMDDRSTFDRIESGLTEVLITRQPEQTSLPDSHAPGRDPFDLDDSDRRELEVSDLVKALYGRADVIGEIGSNLPISLNARVREFCDMSLSMTGVFLRGIALEDPPLEIAAKGHEAIKRYFNERRAGDLPLNEVKILLVGNGSSGKTSLVKRVFGDAFDSNEPQTHGINIRTWTPIAEGDDIVRANFWDFGGQEIMHATHQFFLSKRSLYILVLDGRKEEDPEYWLQHIESFGGDSPIVVVLNKIDEYPAFELNRRFLQTKYPGIVCFCRLSCATGDGIDDFVNRFQEELSRVSILRTRWPSTWFRVKQRLQSSDRDYISFSEYNDLCIEEGVTDLASRETLVDFLHDLGVILHFRDLRLLDTHVLDPRWVTEAVYRIINSELLARQKGVLEFRQLEEVLRPRGAETITYASDKHGYIIELMLKFELCYRLDDNSILVPDLLDIQQPELSFDRTSFERTSALRFVFEYSYLPKSVMPRFIVRMHRDIAGLKRWRTGVELAEKSFGASAVVTADEKEKRVYVFVVGSQRRDYFSVIRKVLADIHSSFEKLGVVELVPLPDAPDVLLDYRELIGHEVSGRDEIFVGRLGRGYGVQSLLNGIESRATRELYDHTTINVQGNYFAQPSVVRVNEVGATMTVPEEDSSMMHYEAQKWERIVIYATGCVFVAVIVFLLIRNQPIADPNLVVLVRILLSLIVSVFGATVPGMLKVDLTAKGLAIRATGALALFVLTYALTPTVLQSGGAR